MKQSPYRRPALVVLSAFFLIVLLEALFRLAGIAPKLPKAYADCVYTSDPILPYRPTPDISRDVLSGSGEFREIFTHNSVGFRDVEHSITKPDGIFRILAIGDSFTYGAGAPFDQTWLFLLERHLNARPNNKPAVEIIKAGIGGYFPEAERLLLEHIGLAYEPDLVLVGFNPSDLFETWQGLDEVRVHDGFLKTTSARRMGRFGTFLYLHSHAARALLDVKMKNARRKAFKKFESCRDQAWAKIETEYDRMRAILPAGVRMAIVIIPFSQQPPPSDIARLLDYGATRNILVIDASPALCSTPDNNAHFFWPIDGHCTPKGYAVLADLVFNAVTLHGLVP